MSKFARLTPLMPLAIRWMARFRLRFLVIFLVTALAGVTMAQPLPQPLAEAIPTAATAANPKDVDGDGISDVTIDTPRLHLILTGKSGNLSVYFLKGANFSENLYPPILLDQGYPIASDALSPFECLIGTETIPNFGYNVTLEEKTPEKFVVVATANVAPRPGKPYLGLTKRYTFSTTAYTFEVQCIVSNLGEEAIAVGDETNGGVALQFGPGLFLDPLEAPCAIVGLKPEAADKFDTQAAFEKAVPAGGFTGVGLKNNYFCTLIDCKAPARIFARMFEIKKNDPSKPSPTYAGQLIRAAQAPFLLKPKESKALTFHVYYGPKLLDELKLINRELVTDYGFLSTVCLRILQFFNAIYPNFGLSIIFLTIVVRILLYPLTLKQTKSMAKIQKIQPMVQDLKDRYRDSPQKFNEEVLKLYQKHDVNPLGGCLPLLLQLPILFALYNTINISVELRKTSFLWMSDLSKADPLYLLPIGVAALMYYQQGQMQNSEQQQMMAFMPMFMFVITWSLPAGLLVYWFTSSVLGVFQQIQANRIMAAMKEEKL